jgi:hypothetical protein
LNRVHERIATPVPGLTRLLAQNRRITKAAKRRRARLVRRHAGRDILCDLLVQMKLQFCIETLAGASPLQNHLQPHSKFFHPPHRHRLFLICSGLVDDQVDRS